MIFPEDPEIREFTSYTIRARKIIIEEFSKLEGRPPNELEIQGHLRMVVVPFGILKPAERQFPLPEYAFTVIETESGE